MSKGSTLPLFAVFLLAACHGDSTPALLPQTSARPSGPAAVKRGPTPEELTAGMVEAVTLGKSTVPVTMKFDLSRRPTVGQPFDLIIALMPQTAANAATLRVTVEKNMQLAASMAAPVEIPSVEPTQVYRLELSMTPTAEGVQLVTLDVTLNQDDLSEQRTFSVPVIVSSGDEPQAGGKH